MKAYQDKKTSMWKWGRKGEYKFTTRDAAYRYGMDMLTQALGRLRIKQTQIGQNHGKYL